MLLPRIITAIIGIPVILISIGFGGIPFLILVMGIILFALNEYFYLLRNGQYQSHPPAGYVLGVLLALSIYFNGTKIATMFNSYITSIAVTLVLLVLLLVEMFFRDPSGSIGRMSVTVFGVFIVSWTFSHLLLIRDMRPFGDRYTFYLFILIWLVDTAAYGFGSKFGKHKLIKEISPKKSVEGVFYGVLAGIVSSLALWKILNLNEFKLREMIFLGIAVTLTAYISDLGESLLKRDAGMKDSDKLLPGHGGILDRFDSFILTAPLFYYYLVIFHR